MRTGCGDLKQQGIAVATACVAALAAVGCGGGAQKGAHVTAQVNPRAPVNIVLPGVVTLSGSVGTVAAGGSITVTAEREPSDVSGVRVAGTGIDVAINGTRLLRPLRVVFVHVSPAHAGEIPVVLHRDDTGRWLPEAATARASTMSIDTTSFSLRVPGWLDPRKWFRGIADSAVDALTSRTDAPPCANSGPGWATLSNRTTLLHTCLVRNLSQSGTVRAEAQLTPNRRFYMWVSIPSAADYVYVDRQSKLVGAALARLFHLNSGSRVLLGAGVMTTAGYVQPDTEVTKTFTASIDFVTAGMSLAGSVLGLANLSPQQLLPALAYVTAQCSRELPSSLTDVGGGLDFLRCVVHSGLEALDNPQKAFSNAVDLLGDKAYAKQSEETLKKVSSRLHLLGKVLKIAGLAGVLRDIWSEVPDAFSQDGADRPGDVLLTLHGIASSSPPAATTPPVAPTSSLAIGSTFDSRCVVAWPTAPTYTSQGVQMTMSCDAVPESRYLFTDVEYPDPNFKTSPCQTLHVHGRVADVARSSYGYSELVIDADQVTVLPQSSC
jgi:hypothetical protein